MQPLDRLARLVVFKYELLEFTFAQSKNGLDGESMTKPRALAAVSIPFLTGTESDQIESVRLAVISLAGEIKAALPC
jgi:hypothetical protein